MKNILLLGLVAIVALGSLFYLSYTENEQSLVSPSDTTTQSAQPEVTEIPTDTRGSTSPDSDRRVGTPSPTSSEAPTGKLKVANFTGTLEKVDVGCFADGECFVEVDGKHITTMMGWSRSTWGEVQGVDGIGGLESHIGETVEVYVRDNSDGTYTLEGSEGFYIKLK